MKLPQSDGFYVYMLQCCDDSLYTGWTNNLVKRLHAHQEGKGSKYTRCHLPVELVYFECCESKRDAMQREYKIKQYTREDKLDLISKQ